MRARDFEQLYADHAQALFGFLVYRTGDRALAEDLLADTFERALRARRRYDPRRGTRKTWLYVIALNRLRDHARSVGAEARAVERLGVARDDDSDPGFHHVELRQSVTAAVACLSDEERETVALRFGGDLSVPQIAKLLDEKVTTIEGRLYRALRKLRCEFDERPGEQGGSR